MQKDINEIIYIQRSKKGAFKIHFKEVEIYKYLRELGYCHSKLDNKTVYYRRDGFEITSLNYLNIKRAFFELIEKGEFSNLPEDLDFRTILNRCFEKHPIKKNGLLDHYLRDTLSETEAQRFRKSQLSLF